MTELLIILCIFAIGLIAIGALILAGVVALAKGIRAIYRRVVYGKKED